MSETEPADDVEEQDTEEAIESDEPEVDESGGIPGIPGPIANRLPPQLQQMMALMKQDHGIAKILLKPSYAVDETGDPQVSQAEAIADMINILRLDTKAIADAVDADVEVAKVTPEKAAVMMQDLVKQDSMDLIETFNEIEEQREEILRQVADEETVEEHREQKQSISYFEQAREEAEDAE